ncbi:MAG: hypothetical protein NC311_17765 [Muribaculaceae bacterium]|nr:hypothetical protein [Muribaculaceae bacterium]
MAKAFDIHCLIDNGIKVNERPDPQRESVNLVFADGEIHKLKKNAIRNMMASAFIWDDEDRVHHVEPLFVKGEESRGNPLLAQGRITYMKEINDDLDRIIAQYSE